jgi:hypothetical protein
VFACASKARELGPSLPPDDPTVCPDIPRPSDVESCLGTGSAPVVGEDASLQCTSSCQDRSGNLWEANCNGATCACTYNRERSCNCVITGTGHCASCCPGTRSE